jgi:hypothetical protein
LLSIFAPRVKAIPVIDLRPWLRPYRPWPGRSKYKPSPIGGRVHNPNPERTSNRSISHIKTIALSEGVSANTEGVMVCSCDFNARRNLTTLVVNQIHDQSFNFKFTI